MSAPTPNVPLLRETLAYIEEHPEEWEQTDWVTQLPPSRSCGTAYCFAAHAVNLHGAEVIVPKSRLDDVTVVPLPGEPVEHLSLSMEAGDGPPPVLISEYAARLLGLNQEIGWRLFDEDNSLDDLRRIVGEICSSAGDAS